MSHYAKGSPTEAAQPRLAAFRKGRGISLEQVAEATKISIRSLRAIEAGDFKKLPGGIYTKNYIKQYAQYVGADERELLSDYDQSGVEKAEPVVAARPRGPLSRLLDLSWALLNP
jgi:cytoskeleton protein RodZ